MTRSDLNLNNLSLAAVAGIPQQFVCDGFPKSLFPDAPMSEKARLLILCSEGAHWPESVQHREKLSR